MSMMPWDTLKETFLLTPTHLENLKIYQDLLMKWSGTYNLMSPKALSQFWERHVREALCLQPYLPSLQEKLPLGDLGTGAGIPGLVLALCGYPEVTMVESQGKKVSFLETVLRKTQCKARIFQGRIENIPGPIFHVVTSRALGSVKTLLGYSCPLLHPQGYTLFLKGEKVLEEVQDASTLFTFSHEIFPLKPLTFEQEKPLTSSQEPLGQATRILKIWNLKGKPPGIRPTPPTSGSLS